MTENVFAAPQGELMNNDQAYGEIKFFSPGTRINRLRYWAHLMVVFYALILVGGVAGLLGYFVAPGLGIAIGGIAYIAVLVFSIITIIQRLHDLDKSGWLCLLSLIPIANLYLTVLVIFFPGTPGQNRFGLQTPPNKTWHWVAALSMPVLWAVIGVLAAISIPAYKQYVERAKQAQSAPVEAAPSEN